MKSPPPSELRLLRLEAAGAPLVDLSGHSRSEHDLAGGHDLPVGALYGIQTLRAIGNFRVSGIELCAFPTLIAALATVKDAVARANPETGRGVYDLVCERDLMTRNHIDRLPDPQAMKAPRATPATDG